MHDLHDLIDTRLIEIVFLAALSLFLHLLYLKLRQRENAGEQSPVIPNAAALGDVAIGIEAEQDLERLELEVWKLRLWVISLTLRAEAAGEGRVLPRRNGRLVSILRECEPSIERRKVFGPFPQICALHQEAELLQAQAESLQNDYAGSRLGSDRLLRVILQVESGKEFMPNFPSGKFLAEAVYNLAHATFCAQEAAFAAEQEVKRLEEGARCHSGELLQ